MNKKWNNNMNNEDMRDKNEGIGTFKSSKKQVVLLKNIWTLVGTKPMGIFQSWQRAHYTPPGGLSLDMYSSCTYTVNTIHPVWPLRHPLIYYQMKTWFIYKFCSILSDLYNLIQYCFLIAVFFLKISLSVDDYYQSIYYSTWLLFQAAQS